MSKTKLWGGRFSKDTNALVDAFNASIDYDKRLYHEDIRGSIAHAHMLAKVGIISQEDAAAIEKGLKEILAEIQAGKFDFSTQLEDIHMNIEAALTDKIGDAGARLHTARSRNDQVALDMHMYMKREVTEIMDLLIAFEEALLTMAEKHLKTLMPGYTHLQRAQPITFAHHMLAYFNMLRRDFRRLQGVWDGADIMPLGAGAVAGTTLPIDRFQVAEELHFSQVYGNSMDAVSDRDYVLEFLSFASLLMMHLSRLSEEMCLWSSTEFGFIELDDAFATGSSMMPQKKNPDISELVRGKTGRVYGHLTALLTTLKGLPLAYNKDLQEDKEPIFDAIDTVRDTLHAFIEMMPGVEPQRDVLREACHAGYPTATDLADYLVRKGVPFRSAHDIVGQIVRAAVEMKCGLHEMPLEKLQSFSDKIGEDVYDSLTLEGALKARNHTGGTAPAQVLRQVGLWKDLFARREKRSFGR